MAEYPPFLDDGGELEYDETKLCGAVSEAIAVYGMPPLAALPAIYAADDEIVASIDILDRYDRWRKHPRVPPVIGGWQEPGERFAEEVFIYLSTSDRHEPAILAAIATLDLPTRVVIAGNPLPSVTVARWRKAVVEERPLPPSEIVRRARVLVHAGNHGISCLGLRAGLPQVTLSDQYEHVFDGRQIAAAGAGIVLEGRQWTVPTIHKAIHDAWANAAMADRAKALAAELAPQFEGDPGEMTADRIEAIIHRSGRRSARVT
jgi:UDP:flavonoid glycosyltransferase YjiC (YdhE family)